MEVMQLLERTAFKIEWNSFEKKYVLWTQKFRGSIHNDWIFVGFVMNEQEQRCQSRCFQIKEELLART